MYYIYKNGTRPVVRAHARTVYYVDREQSLRITIPTKYQV